MNSPSLSNFLLVITYLDFFSFLKDNFSLQAKIDRGFGVITPEFLGSHMLLGHYRQRTDPLNTYNPSKCYEFLFQEQLSFDLLPEHFLLDVT